MKSTSTCEKLTLPNNSTFAFQGLVVARTSGGTSDAWQIHGLIQNNGGTYTLLTATTVHMGTQTWSIAITSAGNALTIAVTGTNGTDTFSHGTGISQI